MPEKRKKGAGQKLAASDNTKKHAKDRELSWVANAAFRVHKRNNKHLGISKLAMGIVQSFVNDHAEKITEEAFKLVTRKQKSKITEQDIEAATKLILPADLAKDAIMKAEKAVFDYNRANNKEA